MSKAIYDLVLEDLKARKEWEDRQRVWYEMRHSGLRRKNKPFPNAADLHYPLIDGVVDKLKPFYFAQIFGSELLGSFTSLRQQSSEATSAAAQWFHFQMVQGTNFFRESLSNIDNMELAGVAPMKLWWDAPAKELTFDAIDPVFLIVPPGTVDLQKADRVTHVLQMTKDAYKRRPDYAQGDEVLKRITGKASEEVAKAQEKYHREGITCNESDNQVVLHEVWKNTPAGWLVHTYSPQAPDIEIKPDYVCPYELSGKKFLPIVDFPLEIKDKGYYASRGIAERIGQYQSYISRVWNEKADHLAFTGRPIFTHDGETINLNNVSLKPGAVIGKNLSAVKFPEPALSFDQEMVGTRMAAEYLIAMPDFGTGQAINTRERKTATEVSATGQLMGMSTDLRARIFRQALGTLYKFAWAILRENKKDSLDFYFADKLQQVDAEALHEKYLIEPDGSPDSWNKMARMQRAQARYQMLRGNENVSQSELTKATIEEDDPRLVRRLFVDPKATMADQQEDQAMELAILEKGWPARVLPADDDVQHIAVVLGRVQAMLQTNEALTPVGWQRMDEHLEGHLQQLQKRNPKAARQAMQQVQRTRQAMAQIFPPAMAGAQPGQGGVA